MSNLSDFLPAGGGSAGGSLKYQDFTSSGTFTPSAQLLANGGQCFVILIGGGGSGSTWQSPSNYGGAFGGNAGQFLEELVTVSGPVTVTIGAGGAAVVSTAYDSSAGNSGSNSTFGALLTALGGAGGAAGNNAAGMGGAGAGGLGGFSTDTSKTLDARGGVGRYGRAGGGGGVVAPDYTAAHQSAVDGGGAGFWGIGSATSGAANTGGGGGGCAYHTSSNRTSGAGGSGWCRVIWFE